jgi:hypothetical protein
MCPEEEARYKRGESRVAHKQIIADWQTRLRLGAGGEKDKAAPSLKVDKIIEVYGPCKP